MIKSGRDFNYIHDRLSVPAIGVIEAYERLSQAGEHDAANDLMEAMHVFTDECRRIRNGLSMRTDYSPAKRIT